MKENWKTISKKFLPFNIPTKNLSLFQFLHTLIYTQYSENF